jgi:signal peptidase
MQGVKMTDIYMLTVWLIISLSFLFFLYHFKNGKRAKIGQLFVRRMRIRTFHRKKNHTKAYLRHLRTLVIKPKPLRAFLPLFILIAVVIFLLNNIVYFAVITSDSMSPTFNKGDMVLMTKYTDVETDDIIMFSVETEQFPVIHRVYKINGENITTKGDFNPTEDRWILNNSVIVSEAVTIGDKPVVLKGVGTYFLEDDETHARYSGEIEFNRLLLQGMKNIAIYIFFAAVLLYIFFTAKEIRERKV